MINVRIDGDEAVLAMIAGLEPKLKSAARLTLSQLVLKLSLKVKEDKLNGQVLNVRSGTLRRSIDHVVKADGDNLEGKVWTNVKYAAKHEYGYNGTESIRSHLRTIKQVYGRAITPREVLVSAHSRKVSLPPRSFMRSALADMRDDIQRAFEQSVGGALV